MIANIGFGVGTRTGGRFTPCRKSVSITRGGGCDGSNWMGSVNEGCPSDTLKLYLEFGSKQYQPIMTINTTELPATPTKVLVTLVLSSSDEYVGRSLCFLAK